MGSNNRHGPNRISNYIDTHDTVLQQFVSRGFIVSNELVLDSFGNRHLTMVGALRCIGGIVLEVRKLLEVVDEQAGEWRIRTVEYSYNAKVQGLGNIVRYDSPHAHRPMHHVHRFDTFAENTNEQIAECEWPTLGDVLTELEAWYYDHFGQLADYH